MKCLRCGEGCGCERAVSIPVDRIIAEFAEAVGMPEQQIRGRQRDQRRAHFRHLCVYLTYMLSGLSFPSLAVFWRRDHSTLVHSCQVAQELVAKHPWSAEIVRTVHDRLVRLAA